MSWTSYLISAVGTTFHEVFNLSLKDNTPI